MRLNGSKELLLNISDQGAYTLQVLDNATIRGGAPYLEIRDNSTNALHYFEGTDNGLVIWADLSNIAASSIIGFNIDGTEKMRLTSAAELLIGSSTDAGAYALQVTGSTYTTAGGVFNPTASSSNYLLMGTTTVRETSGIARGAIQVTGSAGNTGGIIIAGQLANNANGDYLQFIKSRGTSNVAVQSGDDLGGITLAGADGTNYLRGARIRAVVDGTPGTNDMPTRLEFSVTQDGNASPTYWMALNNDGELIIQENPVDAGAYKLQVAGNIYSTGSLTTGAPSGGSIKPWKIGEAATVSPTSPNRTIRVEIDGTVYYIHAKTTND
jgi:hypothetical protein